MIGRERGSEVVQFAVVAPVLLFVVFAIMQVGGMMLSASQVSSDIVRASRQLDVAGLQHAENKEAFVKEGIVGASTQLIPERLDIARVRSIGDRVQRVGSQGAWGEVEQLTDEICLSYEVRYAVPSILVAPGLTDQTFTRQVDCRYVAGRAIEIRLKEHR